MKIDAAFEALGSTTRRKILAYLSEATLTAGEIADRFDMSKPALSKHLKILENAGMVRGEKKGQYVHYSLADENMLPLRPANFVSGLESMPVVFTPTKPVRA